MDSSKTSEPKIWHTIVIGAGQAGLSIGYFLKQMKKDFIILDENNGIGVSWRKRWDSLHLFTPSQYDGLPGMDFPARKGTFPGKDQMADYLAEYAKLFSLPVSLDVRVNKLKLLNGHYEITTSGGVFQTERVVVATGTNPIPYIPEFASDLKSDIFQIHSSQYKNPGSIPPGDTLVVGAATSGIEIALEISETHNTYISGKPTFHIPEQIARFLGGLYWLFISNILTVKTPIGRKAKSKIIGGGGPLLRVSADELDKKGVSRLPRVNGVKNGYPLFADGSQKEISNVIWATGFRPDFSWIESDITDGTGWPVTKRGISLSSKGLYFMGMPFQFGLTSGLVGGVGRDAKYVANHISKF
jgi:putative flavoprotein involved in K+ transport